MAFNQGSRIKARGKKALAIQAGQWPDLSRLWIAGVGGVV